MTIFPQKFLNARKCHEMVRNSYDIYSARFFIDFVRFSNIFWQFSGRETRICTKSFLKLGSAQKWCEIHMISILYKISLNFVRFCKVYGFVGDNNCILQLFVLFFFDQFGLHAAFGGPFAQSWIALSLHFCDFSRPDRTNHCTVTTSQRITRHARETCWTVLKSPRPPCRKSAHNQL